MLSINPATEQQIGKFEMLTEKQTEEEIKKCRGAFESWRKKGINERVLFLKKAAALLNANSRKYGEIMTKEMGKPIKQATTEAEKCAWVCEYYYENAEKFLAPEIVQTENKKSYISFEPLGVILGIMPWNFPFWQVFRFVVPAITAGNVCVLKHSSNVPQCALAIEQIFIDSGLPEYVFKTLLITGAEAGHLIEKNLVDGVSLTGSTEAGKKIGELAGKNIKKVVLELGGSDPFIVLEDADVQLACHAAVIARYQNTGQSCIAAKRFIVHKNIYDEFKNRFIEVIGAQKVGDPMNENTNIGPLARNDLGDALEKQLKQAVKDGAKVLAGGHRLESKGFFFEPTIIECNGNEKILQEETFGPVATLIMAKDDEDALQIANSTEFGLGASVWTKDEKKIEKFARELKAGFVAVNSMVKSDPRLPFGGIKKSGIGRELSEYGIKEFVNVKTVIVN